MSNELIARIDKLVDALTQPATPVIPVGIALWDTKTCATYFNMSEGAFRDRYACLPEFPPAIRLPTATGRKGHPQYESADVIRFARSYKEVKRG